MKKNIILKVNGLILSFSATCKKYRLIFGKPVGLVFQSLGHRPKSWNVVWSAACRAAIPFKPYAESQPYRLPTVPIRFLGAMPQALESQAYSLKKNGQNFVYAVFSALENKFYLIFESLKGLYSKTWGIAPRFENIMGKQPEGLRFGVPFHKGIAALQAADRTYAFTWGDAPSFRIRALQAPKIGRYFYYTAFKLILIFILFYILPSPFIYGQVVEKNITKAISVSENSTIKIQGPQSVRITGNGAINTRQIKGQYIVSGKNSKPYIYVIHKKMQIETWGKDSLKQIVNVLLDCENKSETERLLNAFEIELETNSAGNILVSCELNIAKFKIENGWFSADDNHLILKDGKRYPVKYLEISTLLYVPINSRIALEATETAVALNSHLGSLDLNMRGGRFRATRLGEIKAELKSVKVDIEGLGSGTLRIKDCELNLDTVNNLIVESSISKFKIKQIKSLVVTETLNDHFEIGALGKLSVAKSLFSNYDIKRAKESIDVTAKNGDIRVAALDADLAFINIKNQHAKVSLGIQNLQSYQVNCKSINQSKYKIPQTMTIAQKSESEKVYQLGSNPEKTKIDIDCSQCEVNLKHFSF